MAMLPQIVEVSTPGRRIRLERGFLKIADESGDLGALPVADISALITSTPAISFTGQALAALAEHGAPVVLCGANFSPSAYLLPASGHHAQGFRVEAQAGASLPMKKRIWAEIVKAKLTAQADALDRVGVPDERLRTMAARMLSGDPLNREAAGAQLYFPALMGKGFTRNRDAEGVNAFLNYGYTVLRAAAARAVIGAGLHPSFGVHHKSRGDGLRLADDLMEPFRPVVDLVARDLKAIGVMNLTPDAKRRLAAVLTFDYPTKAGISPLSTVMVRLAISMASVFMKERRKLDWPKSMLPAPAEPADAP
ncbi:MAG: type II CRISPR-associated endonuclease Cas1 [Hyphomonadaceae bacterium]